MRLKIASTVALILAMGLSTAFAGNPQRLGTSGALELVIPAGSRGVALGGSVVANSSGVDAIYWNPAGLANLEGTEVMASHLPYLADIDVEYGAIGTSIEDFGTIALSIKVVDIGELIETSEAFPEGTGRVFSPSLTVIGLTFAKSLTSNVNFGFTTNFIREDILDVSASGVAFDFGFTYNPRWQGLTIGLVMKNFGPDMKFSGSGFERILPGNPRRVSSEERGFELPTSLNIGVAYNFLNNGLNHVTLMGNFRSNNQSIDNWQGGLEYDYNSRFFLRGGYTLSEDDNFIYGASFGGGLKVPVGTSELTLEYTWTETETFDDNQYFTARFSF